VIGLIRITVGVPAGAVGISVGRKRTGVKFGDLRHPVLLSPRIHFMEVCASYSLRTRNVRTLHPQSMGKCDL
jgi:hypothetical protein